MLRADVTPPGAFRGIPEDYFRFIAADADRGPFPGMKIIRGTGLGSSHINSGPSQIDGGSSDTSR